ncbi:MAG: M14 family metallopeptidase [bacterium]|nr:M14 family metallopeptidase [bacterium]
MRLIFEKRTLTAILIVAVLAAGIVWFFVLEGRGTPKSQNEPAVFKQEIIGQSVEGRSIEAYTYGSGAKHLVFVGGIHGGYEWNSVVLAYEFLDYLENTSGTLPAGLTVTVIPSANPDGVFNVVGKEGRFAAGDVPTSQSVQAAGRFNANKVDLNRNFDCKWQPKSTWRGAEVSAGTAAFSEPEAKAIRDFALREKPAGFIFWHSQANAVYASECKDGILAGTMTLMNTYAKAAGYPAVDTFDAYEVTGDAEGWLASIDIPAITVELKTHETIEWENNLAGVKALFNLYREP